MEDDGGDVGGDVGQSRATGGDPVREGEHERGVMGGSCVPAWPLRSGTCWAIWRPCNWVGVLHLSGTPP